MQKKYKSNIQGCALFKQMSDEAIDHVIHAVETNIQQYEKGETIFDEGEQCEAIAIILDGKIELSTYFISGDVSNLITLNAGDIFGEAILFSPKDHYPISITSVSKSAVLYIPKSKLIELLEAHPVFLENYLRLLSQKLLFLNDKFKLLSLSTIRGKIAHVLIKLSKEQKSNIIQLPFSKEKMALHICTRRPSLSRELSKMKHEGLIDYEKSTIKILDMDALADELY